MRWSGSDAFLTDAPCRRRRAECGLRKDWLTLCRCRTVRNGIDSTPAGGGWINPKSGGEANAQNPAVSGRGLIRNVADPKDCTQMKSPAGIGFHGYLIRSRFCFRFDDLELPEYRTAKSEETGEGIRAGNAFPSGTAGRKAAAPAAADARRAEAGDLHVPTSVLRPPRIKPRPCRVEPHR